MTATEPEGGARPSAPRVPHAPLAERVRSLYGFEGSLERLDSSIDQNALLRSKDGSAYVVKVANRFEDRETLDLQNRVMEQLARAVPGACPRVVRTRSGEELTSVTDADGAPHALRVLTWLEGPLLADALSERHDAGAVRAGTWRSLGELLGRTVQALSDLEHPAAGRALRWDLARAPWVLEARDVHPGPQRRVVEEVARQFLADVVQRLDALPAGLIHGDANEGNVLVAADASGVARATALIDFGDCVHTARVFELAVAGAYALLAPTEHADPLAALEALAQGFDAVEPLTEAELEALWPAVLMRLAVSVTVSALDARLEPDNAYLTASQEPAWRALERFADFEPAAVERRLRVALGRPVAVDAPAPSGLATRRERLLNPGLSLSYTEPLTILRGRGAFLYDGGGRAYLDCVNNVCHVGHCHPHVTAALARQVTTLNTNTRYLHPEVLRYAERLTAMLPESLEVCTFVNSGSEANELALRMARAATGRHDVVVLEAGYHGHTSALIDLSHYKHAGPGGRGTPPWVHVAALPDAYRGQHRGAGAGAAYAADVADALGRAAERGPGAAAFLAEPVIGCGGQVVPPEGYLRAAFAHARAAGAVCIADEVQIGFGRVGTHWWAFEQQGAVPDIVTLGKPIGNGHPLAAVVTTRAVAEAFANGMEYFSTFGGNPVSAAVGNAVLDVLEREQLRENARMRGEELHAGFHALAERHAVVGDVRGTGLYLGLAVVRDRASREPAPDLLAAAVESARRDGVLLSIDGPAHDVLKVKPPLVFRSEHVQLLLGAFERGLERALDP